VEVLQLANFCGHSTHKFIVVNDKLREMFGVGDIKRNESFKIIVLELQR